MFAIGNFISTLFKFITNKKIRLEIFSSKKPDIDLASRAFQEHKKLFAIEEVDNMLKMTKNLVSF